MAKRPGTRVIRLLLMIGLVAYLIDLKRGSEADAVCLRAAYANLLSGFTDFGEMNRSMREPTQILMLRSAPR